MSIGDPAELDPRDNPESYDGEHCQDCGEAQPYGALRHVERKWRCAECVSDLSEGATPTAELCDGVTLPLETER